MKQHLSQEQFSRCFLGTATSEERRHVLDCGECRMELESFATSVASLRSAIRERVDVHITSQPVMSVRLEGPPRIRWALVSVALLLIGMLPLLTTMPDRNAQPAQVATSPEAPETPEAPEAPEALMNAINVHLSRTVPSPMEPMMPLLPGDEIVIFVGGNQ